MPRCRLTGFAAVWLALGRLSAQTSEDYHQRADVALETFLLKFWSQGLGYLKASHPEDWSPTGYWTFAQGFGVERTEGRRYAGLIQTFYDAQARRGWLQGYYDDESWMSLALLRAHDLTGDGRYLDTAKFLVDDIQSGWDTTCCGGQKGGVWWDKAHTQKATASNAGPVIAAVRLHERTGDGAYLDFARRVYSHWFRNMVNHSTFQVTDHINPDGTKVFWKFTYNEGLMIGASIELYRATKDPLYLANANDIAGFLATSEVTPTRFGSVLHDGSNQSCTGDCAQFKGPAYRYLKLLGDLAESASYQAILKSSADAIWSLARNTSEDLFSVSWSGPPTSTFSEPQVAAAVMALNLFAESTGPFPGTGAPSSQYEAEDASISGVGLEAAHAGFTGWGYVAGWNGDGQAVIFKVRTPAAGSYDVIFRYAGGAGDSSRRVIINGAVAYFLFPGTGSWSSYKTVSARKTLPAGENVIAVVQDAAAGNGNFLNLDHLRLKSLVPLFERGDANADGILDLIDAVAILLHLFGQRPALVRCRQAADADLSGSETVTDALFILRYLFQLGPPPPAPFPDCGPSSDPGALGCASYPPCE